MARPRLIESEHNWWQLKKFYDKRMYRVLFFSDPHGWLCDLRAIRCIAKILQAGKFDEVCVNGDLVDLPYLSKHAKRLYGEGILKDYTEVGEIEYTKESILKPIRNSTDAVFRVRLGNHDERITKPFLISKSQQAQLNVLYKHYKTTELDVMLGLTRTDNYIYDPSDCFTYFGKFDVVHGLSLAKNAPEKNMQEYMSSGASGHTHRLHPYYRTNKRAPYVWFELGCTRLVEQVEYFGAGRIADWQQGLVVVSFYEYGNEVRFFGEPVNIIEGVCYYNGVIYNGN